MKWFLFFLQIVSTVFFLFFSRSYPSLPLPSFVIYLKKYWPVAIYLQNKDELELALGTLSLLYVKLHIFLEKLWQARAVHNAGISVFM